VLFGLSSMKGHSCPAQHLAQSMEYLPRPVSGVLRSGCEPSPLPHSAHDSADPFIRRTGTCTRSKRENSQWLCPGYLSGKLTFKPDMGKCFKFRNTQGRLSFVPPKFHDPPHMPFSNTSSLYHTSVYYFRKKSFARNLITKVPLTLAAFLSSIYFPDAQDVPPCKFYAPWIMLWLLLLLETRHTSSKKKQAKQRHRDSENAPPKPAESPRPISVGTLSLSR